MRTAAGQSRGADAARPTRQSAGPRHAATGRSRIRIRIEPKYNYWGDPLPRPLPAHVIRSALMRRAAAPGGFLSAALARIAGDRTGGGPPVRSAVFDHFQEGDTQMVFRCRVDPSPAMRPVRLAVLVSKGSPAAARVAAAEYRWLRRWSQRVPDLVVEPLAGESIPVPGTAPGARAGTLFVYATPWLTAFHELGVSADLRFFVNEHPVQRFPAAWTDIIKSRILALCLALYDPKRRRAIEPPLIGAGDIMITRPVAGAQPAVKLIAARGERPVADLADCLNLYLAYAGEWGGRRFTLVPENPACLGDAVMEGLVRRHGIAVGAVRQALARIGWPVPRFGVGHNPSNTEA